MLEISVRFLGGEFVALNPESSSEWPPHPARLFYALVAAWYDGDCQETEAKTLRWLESQEAPDIVADPDAPAEEYLSWVPMNSLPTLKEDKKTGSNRAVLVKTPLARASRFVGDNPVAFVWKVDIPSQFQESLRNLCGRCTRIGSSESIVAVTVRRRTDSDGPAWRPGSSGTMLRVPTQGVIDAIARTETLLPGRVLHCGWRAYHWSRTSQPSKMITVALTSGRCPVEHAPQLAYTLRRALIAVADDNQLPLLPVLHGHSEDGSPLQESHLQFCPLPYVGFRGATGAVLGIAFVLPPTAIDTDRSYVERVVATWFSSGGKLTMTRRESLAFGPTDSRYTLTEQRWCKAAEVWQTVIPMELPRHCTKRRAWNQAVWKRVSLEVVRACSQSGFPEPVEVEPSSTPFAIGSPSYRTIRGPRRHPLVHARVMFPYAIEGPVVIGAGRHLGYGLMEPLATLP